MKHVLLGLAVVLCACRFGGPSSDDPNALPPHDVGPEAEVAADDTGVDQQDTTTPEFDTGTPTNDTGGGSDTGMVATDTGSKGETGSCAPTFTSAVCDPVENTGCGSASRCDVDDGTPQAGRCVGLASLGEGAFCTKTSLTDTCGSKLTCVSNACKKLCHCDSDCGGRCCKFSVPAGSGASGFMACDDC